jgi:hypothetical protein
MAKKKTPKSESKSPDDDEPPKLSGLRERLARSRANAKTPIESPEQIRARIETTIERAKAKANSPGRESKQSLIRYPTEDMHNRIARLAAANGRSMNAEIIDRLQKSMIGDQIANLEEMVGWHSEQIERLEDTVKDLAEQLRHRK